ncbi:DUF4974 domain-containing protein [Wenyingzhuangia sp. 1_MG-2023]|nr:DUF4974 domain-containing protein [Wenyingzhuangia sp. 1_MG-2023]
MLNPEKYNVNNLMDNDDFVIWVTSGYKIKNEHWQSVIDSLTKSEKKEFDSAILMLSRLKRLDVDEEKSKKSEEFINQQYQLLMNDYSSKKSRVVRLNSLYKYAAVLLVLISVTGTLLLSRETKNTFASNLVETNFNTSDILIQTPDQKYYKVSKDENNKWLNEDGVLVDISSDAIRFHTSDKSNNAGSDQYKVIVPEGKRYTVVLIDSTNIELNSNTSIAFNNSLTTEYRHIDLQGEAFFDVAHDKNRPFIVQSSDLKIEVLGTEFNVSNYETNDFTSTTLIDGSINVSTQQGESKIIKPGSQAILYHNQSYIAVEKVNVQKAVSWTLNRMIFEDENLENITQKLSAWYPVTFHLNGENIKQVRFTGTLKKENSLMHFLQMLKYTEGISYTINKEDVTLFFE